MCGELYLLLAWLTPFTLSWMLIAYLLGRLGNVVGCSQIRKCECLTQSPRWYTGDVSIPAWLRLWYNKKIYIFDLCPCSLAQRS